MTTKHEVDPTTQASMLAPTPAALATGVMVELEGGFYNLPVESAVLNPEQTALKAEDDALFFLDMARTTQRNITNMEKHQRALKHGKVKPGTDIPSELERLASADEKTGQAVGVIPTAQEHYGSFRRQAKIAFAKSIGIDTVTEEVERHVEGTPQSVRVVYAEQSERQAELTSRYKAFYNKYGQASDEATAARAARRQEISERFAPKTAS